ncbi:MAG: hypothetical protein PHG08_00305 [Bacilli bacterium]|nr:hypothetical protein [Bacilli bacterium]
MSDQSPDFAGQIEIIKLEITSQITGNTVGLTGIMLEMNIYEDIFSNYITGTITVSDSIDLVNYLPLVGEERLEISYKTPGMSDKDGLVSNIFYVYKISDRGLVKEKNQVYVIHFMSEEAFSDLHVKISKAYKGVLSEIAKSVFSDGDALGAREEVANKLVVEKTDNSFAVVVPTWSPIKTLNWLAARSINKNGVANYVFYQDSFNYNFISIDQLMSKDPKIVFWDTTLNVRQLQDVYKGEDISAYNIVRQSTNDLAFDISTKMMTGVFSSTMINCDLLNRSINIQEFDYIDSFDKSNHLNKYPTNSSKVMRNPHSCVVMYVNHHQMFDNIESDYPEKWLLQRRSLTRQIDSYRTEIVVAGRTDYKCGTVVDYRFNTVRSHDTDDEAEELLNKGNYLIAAINHRIAKNEHECIIQLVKDSSIMDLK